MKLSEKQADVLFNDSRVEILEGEAGSGKTLIAKKKFIFEVNESKLSQHFIAAFDGGVAYRNLVDDDMGLLKMYRTLREGKAREKGSHLIFTDTKGREKIIYVFGFGDKAKWKKVLGGTVGCGLVDEVHLADKDFIIQVFRGLTRFSDFYLCLTLNPTNPNAKIYDIINRARPLKKYTHEIPKSIINDLAKAEADEDATYWHFKAKDNPTRTIEAIESFKRKLIPGSPEWQSLVEGIRCVAEGSIWAKYLDNSFLLHDLSKFKKQDRYGIWRSTIMDYHNISIDIGNNQDGSSKSMIQLTSFSEGFNDIIYRNAEVGKATEVNALVQEWVRYIAKYYDKININAIYVDGYAVSELIVNTLRDALTKARIYTRVELVPKFEKYGRRPRKQKMDLLIEQKRIWWSDNKSLDMHRLLVYSDKEPGLPLDNNEIQNDYYDVGCYGWLERIEDIK